jgi:hypothetical protein
LPLPAACSNPPGHRWYWAALIMLQSTIQDSFFAFRAGLTLLPDNASLKNST